MAENSCIDVSWEMTASLQGYRHRLVCVSCSVVTVTPWADSEVECSGDRYEETDRHRQTWGWDKKPDGEHTGLDDVGADWDQVEWV